MMDKSHKAAATAQGAGFIESVKGACLSSVLGVATRHRARPRMRRRGRLPAQAVQARCRQALWIRRVFWLGASNPAPALSVKVRRIALIRKLPTVAKHLSGRGVRAYDMRARNPVSAAKEAHFNVDRSVQRWKS
jgi:hypothetical protein